MADMDKIAGMFQQIDGNMKQMNRKMDVLMMELKQIKDENKRLSKKVEEQEDRIGRLERAVRSKNIVIKGIADEERENENLTKEKIDRVIQKIGVNVEIERDIDEIGRIGKFEEGKKRPILVKLLKESTKSKILKNAKQLKGTTIWIEEDFPKNIQEERRTLIPRLKEARNRGHRAVLKYNKLIVDGEIYRGGEEGQWKEVEQEEDEEGARSAGMKRTVEIRSPEGDSTNDHTRKITKTMTTKN